MGTYTNNNKLSSNAADIMVSRLKARGEISLKMANGGEFATSMRNRWIGSVSDGRETSRSVTAAGDLSGALPSQNRRVTRVSNPGLETSVSAALGAAVGV
jgi:hypothetical protein